MFSIIITDKSGAQRTLDFSVSELSIGRLEGNDLVLPRSNVSKRHARLLMKEDRYVLQDLKSTNGTYVNGRRISAPIVVSKGDKVYIGDFILTLNRSAEEQRQQRSALGAAGRIRQEPRPVRQETHQGVSEDVSAPPGETGGDIDTVMAPIQPMQPGGVIPPTVVPQRPFKPGPPPPPPSVSASRTVASPAPQVRPDSGPVSVQSVPPDDIETDILRRSSPPPGAGPSSPPDASDSQPSDPPRRPSFPPRLEDPDSGKTSPAVLSPSLRLQSALSSLMERLGADMDTRAPAEGPFPSEHEALLDRLVDEMAAEGAVGPDVDRRFLRESAICEAVGLGPLDRLLSNQSVREVVVDGPSRILANLGGELSPVSSFFSSGEALLVVAQRLWARTEEALDPHAPAQTVVLPDGSQVQLLLPPLSPQGPLLSVRCPARAPVSADVLVTEGLLSPDMLQLLRRAVRARRNVLVTGAPGAGVTVLLSAMLGLCQDHERIVTIEDAQNMAIPNDQRLQLNRAGNRLSLDELLRHAARLRYDRLAVDDLRPADALPMLLTASGGHGVMMGMHAASPAAALQQLELFAGGTIGGTAAGALSGLLPQAVQVIVHVDIDRSGARRVQHIAELLPRGEGMQMQTLYRHEGGAFRATEVSPSFD